MNTLKKVSALVIAFMLIFSMCMVSVSAAETEASTATVLYMKPGSNWVQSSPRYAMYLFNSKENTWVDMTDEDGDGYYEAEVPAGDWTTVIFCRMDPAKKTNNWTNKWNQTSDLAIPSDGTNCYLVKDGTWDKGGGEWTTYTPGEEPSTSETEATEAPSYKYTVAGDAGLCGVAWDPAAAENALTDEDGDGVYEITYKDVPAGTYSFKVTDGTWNNSWGKGSGNYSINLNDTSDVTIKFTESTKAIEVVSTGLGDFVLKHMTVVGDEGLVGAKWDPKAPEGVMTQDEDGIWNITFENVAAGEYSYKFIANDNYTYNWTVEGYFDSSLNSVVEVANDGADVTLTIDVSGYDFAAKKGSVKATQTVTGGTPTEPTESTDPTEPTEATEPTVAPTNDYYLFGTINGANYGCEDDWETIGDYKFVDGKLSVTFDTVSYVAVKTGDNSGWYMTDGWQGITKSTTLYSTSLLGEDANKLIVPAGKVDFTLVENEDGTLTLSYESENEPEIPTEPATDPTESTDPTVTPTTDYYLFGTINGANYGCEDDWETIGDYKFVDGKLSVTFDTLSYVAVKTGDNKGWYMTDGWQGITKSTTLYSTSLLGEDANKLIVPAGKVDFTLTENEDGTLTLSYESENEPVIPTEPTTEEPITEPTTPTEPGKTATVYFAAPRVAPGRTVWSDVDIYYNDTTSVIKSNRIHMVDTGLVVDNPNGAKLKTTRRGNWHVFSAELTADQVNAIDNAKYAGFVYAGNYNLKTSAKFDIKMGKSIADFDGQVFLINAATTNSEVDSYTGEWTTAELTKPEYKATTLKFACPTQNWSGGVYFYYGSSSVITTVTKLEMKDSGQTLAVSDDLVSALTKYKGGDWKIYTIDLTAEQVELIDNSSVSGFCSGSSIYVKTSSARNVFRDYNSVSELSNYAFVATNCTNASQERASLTGKWRWCKL